MIKHITVSDRRMTISARRCSESALKFGCDESEVYLVPDDIHRDDYLEHRDIWKQDRGAGYWAWKPYFLLNQMNWHWPEYLVYTDAGIDFVSHIKSLINEMDGNIMLFGNGWKHVEWCKADVLEAMGVPLNYTGDQAQASCLILKSCSESTSFLREWKEWCLAPGMIDDSPSVIPNVPGFREHRHDQAILTNLAIKHGIPFNRWPAQYKLRGNEKYTNTYPQIFLHHRKRDHEYT